MTYAKFDLKIHYPPNHEHEVWHYEQANVDHIWKAGDLFLRQKAFINPIINNVGFLFKKTVKNVISSYIPHETVTFDDRDPPWINKNVKLLKLEKNEMYKKYIKEKKDAKMVDKGKGHQNEPSKHLPVQIQQ